MYTNVDIYYEQGTTYAKDTEVWCEAVPYDSSVTPTPIPPKQSIYTDGFPRIAEVTDAIAYVRLSADASSPLILALGKGKGLIVTGVEYDGNNNAWYKVSHYVGDVEYVGYVTPDSLYVSATVPNVGGGSVNPTPTTTPSGGGVGGGTRPEVTPAVGAGQATVIKNRTGVYEEPSTQAQFQHYLYEGALVYVIEVLDNGWYFVRYDVGGLIETGYVYSENVSYDTENGTASENVTSDYQAHVSDLLGMIGAVPMMIGAVFSFLPPWCLAIVGVAFTSLIGLILWKVARG